MSFLKYFAIVLLIEIALLVGGCAVYVCYRSFQYNGTCQREALGATLSADAEVSYDCAYGEYMERVIFGTTLVLIFLLVFLAPVWLGVSAVIAAVIVVMRARTRGREPSPQQ